MTTEQIPALAWSTDNCTVGRAMAILGERWTFVVLREVFNGVRRFEDIRSHGGIPRQVLTDRLALLVEHGILARVPYRAEGQRERHEYRLTPKGFDLYPVLVAIADWGARTSPTQPGRRSRSRTAAAARSCTPRWSARTATGSSSGATRRRVRDRARCPLRAGWAAPPGSDRRRPS